MAKSNSLIREAREIARHCPNIDQRAILVALTDELQNIFSQFTISCDRADMCDLVGAWTRVIKAIDAINKLGGDDTPQGSMEVPKELLTKAA